MEVSFAEILKHGNGVEAGLGAGDGNVSISAVHCPYAARIRHTVTDANLRFFSLLLAQQSFASSASTCLDVTVGFGVFTDTVSNNVLAGLRVQSVAELSCQPTTCADV